MWLRQCLHNPFIFSTLSKKSFTWNNSAQGKPDGLPGPLALPVAPRALAQA